METAEHPTSTTPELPKAIPDFFAQYNTKATQNLLAHLFKAWASQPETKKQHTDEDIALFLDQLIRLVAAAEQQLHQTNRALTNPISNHTPQGDQQP